MSESNVSRRQAGQIMLSAAAGMAIASSALGAQPYDKKKKKEDKTPSGTQPSSKAPPPIDFTKILRRVKPHDWILKSEVNVDAFVRQPVDRKKETVKVEEFNFTSASVIFPLLKMSAAHRVYDKELKSRLLWDQSVMFERVGPLDAANLLDTYPSGTRLGRWDLKNVKGRTMKLEVEQSMTSFQLDFDSKLADQVPWPAGGYSGPVAPSTFNDIQQVGSIRLVEHTAEIVQDLVRGWCDNKDPKTVPPAILAKFLASNVLEYIQPSGDGLNFADNGLLQGIELQGSTRTLQQKRGTDQDITCALCAVLRAAGLPARTVIGYDVQDDKSGGGSFLKKKRDIPAFRSWVEFCLYDEASRKECWVPIDITRQRRKSSRILSNQNAWRYFGENDEFDSVCPFAFQFHPPTTVVAHGSISFWGWLTFPEAAKATQFLRFSAMTTPKTASTNRQREDDPGSTPPSGKP